MFVPVSHTGLQQAHKGGEFTPVNGVPSDNYMRTFSCRLFVHIYYRASVSNKLNIKERYL